MATKEKLFAYIKESLGTEPDYPFSRAAETAIFRHAESRKWFAAVLRVPFEKLGLPGDGECDVVDLKCDPLMAGSFRSRHGVLPGYHMNKEHWLTVLLDGSVDCETLWQLVDLSYSLTAPAKRNGKKIPAAKKKNAQNRR